MRHFGWLLLLGSTLATLATAQSPEIIANTIQVSATGQFQADPDTALVQMEVTGQDTDLRQAYAKAQAQAEQLRQLLRSQGFTPEQAKLGNYAVQPNIDYRTQTHKVTDYTVSASLQLELTDFTKLGPLLDAAGAAGFSALRGVSFELKNMDAAKAAAIADGYRQAHQEAEALAHAADRTLDNLTYATVDVSVPVSIQQPRVAMQAMASAMPAPTEQFTPHQLTVTARVSAVYRIGQ